MKRCSLESSGTFYFHKRFWTPVDTRPATASFLCLKHSLSFITTTCGECRQLLFSVNEHTRTCFRMLKRPTLSFGSLAEWVYFHLSGIDFQEEIVQLLNLICSLGQMCREGLGGSKQTKPCPTHK